MRRVIPVSLCVLFAAAWAWGAAPLPQPPAVQKSTDYELRLIRVGNTFQSVRCKVSTGESWVMAGNQYEKVPETGPVPLGDYDITLIADDNNWMAFRIDRLTGATWQLRNNQWNKVKE